MSEEVTHLEDELTGYSFQNLDGCELTLLADHVLDGDRRTFCWWWEYSLRNYQRIVVANTQTLMNILIYLFRVERTKSVESCIRFLQKSFRKSLICTSNLFNVKTGELRSVLTDRNIESILVQDVHELLGKQFLVSKQQQSLQGHGLYEPMTKSACLFLEKLFGYDYVVAAEVLQKICAPDDITGKPRDVVLYVDYADPTLHAEFGIYLGCFNAEYAHTHFFIYVTPGNKHPFEQYHTPVFGVTSKRVGPPKENSQKKQLIPRLSRPITCPPDVKDVEHVFQRFSRLEYD